MHEKLVKLKAELEAGDEIKKIDLSNCGLTEFPMEVLLAKGTVEILNLGGNFISSLPDQVTEMKKLRILFFAGNNFSSIPSVLGKMDSLFMLSFKSNKLKIIPEDSLNPSVCWLILTDNQIEELPLSIGKLKNLQKCMLAGNQLKTLPETMKNCKKLELLRLSANKISKIPDWLLTLPRLTWLAIGGNNFKNPVLKPTELEGLKVLEPVEISWNDLNVLEQLGEGASGVVKKGIWKRGSEEVSVAIKLFKGVTTSDGLPKHEMEATESIGKHPNFIEVLGRLTDSPINQLGLIFPLLDLNTLSILGDPPSFSTITRDTYVEGTQFSLKFVLKVLIGISAACLHLHNNCNLMHGDLYAHNILTDSTGLALLTDFGAASSTNCFSREEKVFLEGFEVRAFGCLVEDLLTRVEDNEGEERDLESGIKFKLKGLMDSCMREEVILRPNFFQINTFMKSL